MIKLASTPDRSPGCWSEIPPGVLDVLILPVADQHARPETPPDKDIAEIGGGQQVHQGHILPEIGGRLGPEAERFAMARLPGNEFVEDGRAWVWLPMKLSSQIRPPPPPQVIKGSISAST